MNSTAPMVILAVLRAFCVGTLDVHVAAVVTIIDTTLASSREKHWQG